MPVYISMGSLSLVVFAFGATVALLAMVVQLARGGAQIGRAHV